MSSYRKRYVHCFGKAATPAYAYVGYYVNHRKTHGNSRLFAAFGKIQYLVVRKHAEFWMTQILVRAAVGLV